MGGSHPRAVQEELQLWKDSCWSSLCGTVSHGKDSVLKLGKSVQEERQNLSTDHSPIPSSTVPFKERR